MSPVKDYGLSLDRAWVISRVIGAVILTIVSGWYNTPFLFLVMVYLALKVYVLLNTGVLEAHIVSGTSGTLFWVIVAISQMLSGGGVAAVLAAGMAFDSFAYHRASLRRIAFFRARLK